jgi:hypothetical protein
MQASRVARRSGSYAAHACHAWCDDDEDVVADRWIDAVMRAGTGDTAVEGSPGPGFGAWPGIAPGVSMAGFQAHLVAAGPGRDGQLYGRWAGGTGRAVPMADEPWGTPGKRPRLLPPPWVTHRLGGSVILKNASPGQPWPAPPPSRRRITAVLTRQRMKDHNVERVP